MYIQQWEWCQDNSKEQKRAMPTPGSNWRRSVQMMQREIIGSVYSGPVSLPREENKDLVEISVRWALRKDHTTWPWHCSAAQDWWSHSRRICIKSTSTAGISAILETNIQLQLTEKENTRRQITNVFLSKQVDSDCRGHPKSSINSGQLPIAVDASRVT